MRLRMIYAEENSAALYAQGSDTCVVQLPGYGYTFERPLLERARELALQAGCDVLCLSFGELPIDRQRMKDSVAACLPIAHERAKAILDQLSYARRLWIAKSFGTIVAGMLRKAQERCVMLTPLRQTFPYIHEDDLVCYGDQDPFLDEEDLGWLKQCPASCLRVPGADHSLADADHQPLHEAVFSAVGALLDEVSPGQRAAKDEDIRPIGIFDSGLGGISVLRELRRCLPHEHFLYYGDSAHAPYGVRERADIRRLCIDICTHMIECRVKAIVIACNTATSACVNELRALYPQLPIVGMEPALKVAAERGAHQRIIVTATQLTLKEQKFARLMERFQNEHTIWKQPCPRLVELVEEGRLHERDTLKETLTAYLAPYDLTQVDSIVLGCTHFVFYRPVLRELLPAHVALIDGNRGTVLHLMDLLKQRGALCTQGHGGIVIENSSADPQLLDRSLELLEE